MICRILSWFDSTLAAFGEAFMRSWTVVERAYRLDAHTWGIFSLDRLARTPEFRQAASDMPHRISSTTSEVEP